MKQAATPTTTHDQAGWAARQAANRRLGWIFGGVALALFLIALWKYRPF